MILRRSVDNGERLSFQFFLLHADQLAIGAIYGHDNAVLVGQTHAVDRAIPNCAQTRLRFQKGELGTLALGNVPSDPGHPSHLSFSIHDGKLGGGNPAKFPIGTSDSFHFVDDRAAGLHNVLFVGVSLRGVLGGEKIKIGFTDCFIRATQAQHESLCFVDPGETRILVFKIDGVRYVIHQ